MAIFKKTIPALLISTIIAVISQQALAETLRDAVARTVNTNPDVKISEKIRSASNEEVNQAYAGYYPAIDLNAGYGRESALNFSSNFKSDTLWRKDLGITARQMVFDGFATKYEVKRTKAKTNADSYRVWGTAEDQALAAVQAYLDIMRNEELVANSRQNLGVNQHTYGMVKHLSEQGVGREADTEQTSGRVDLAEANLKSAENNLVNAKVAFQKITGVYPEQLEKAPDVNPALLPKSRQEAVQWALEKHPTLKSAAADIAQARGEYQASKSKFYPRIDLVLSGLQSRNVDGARGPDHDRLAELQLNYNILSGGKDLALTRESAYHVQQATEVRNRTYLQVVEQAKLSWEAYVSSQNRLPWLVGHVKSQELTAASYNRQFGLNKRTLLDVLDSQNELYTAKQDLINERYSLLLAKYRLLNSQGILVQYFKVPLPAEATVQYGVCKTCKFKD